METNLDTINLSKLAITMIESAKNELLESGEYKNKSITTSILLDEEYKEYNDVIDNQNIILKLMDLILDSNEVEKIAIKYVINNNLEFDIKFY